MFPCNGKQMSLASVEWDMAHRKRRCICLQDLQRQQLQLVGVSWAQCTSIDPDVDYIFHMLIATSVLRCRRTRTWYPKVIRRHYGSIIEYVSKWRLRVISTKVLTELFFKDASCPPVQPQQQHLLSVLTLERQKSMSR